MSSRRALLFLVPLSRFASLEDEALAMGTKAGGADNVLVMGPGADGANAIRAG
jgi:hypothetical protein